MIYADVIVGSRTNVQELTYAIPASIIPYIRVGSTVIVSLRRQNVTAVVVGLCQSVSKEVRPLLKDVLQIDKADLGYTVGQIETIKDLANYYGCSLAEVAYHALVWPQNISEKYNKTIPAKPTFIQALWPDRMKLYLELIQRYNNKQSFVFAFGSEQYLINFNNYCKKNNIKLIKLGNSKNEKIIQNKLLNNEIFICAGLQKSSFVSIKNNDFLIIDQPDSISYKSQRRPYMSAKRIGLIRAKNEGIRLIMGANLMSVNDYPNRLERSWRVIEKKLQPITLSIFDRNKTSGLILAGVLEEINIKHPTLFLAASKAWAPTLYCRNCNRTVACITCGRSISVISKQQLSCLYCGHKQKVPAICPNCRSDELKPIGEGSLQLYERLEAVFGADSIALVSSLTKNAPEHKMVVATEKIMSFPAVRFETVIIANMDRQLVGTNIDGSWQLLNLLLQLRMLTSKIIIQTHFPEHWVWAAMSSGNLSSYYRYELAERKQYKLPPFGQKMAALGVGSSVKSLQKMGQEISEKLINILPMLDMGEAVVNYGYGRNYRANVPIFSPKVLSSKQKHLIREQLPPSWYLDVEPI